MTEIKDQTARNENKSQAEGDRPNAATPATEIGRDSVIGRYKVLERLGSNAAAAVYSAYDSQLDRIVALKVLSSQPDVALRERVVRDAQAMTHFRHPHVVTVHDAGTLGDRVYVAMEFVDGSTLRRWIRKARPWREVLDVLKAAARGLAAAHEAGLVHRDLKPENILVSKDGRVLVSDFGLAYPEATAAPRMTPVPTPAPVRAVETPSAAPRSPATSDDADSAETGDATVAAKRNSRKPPAGESTSAPPSSAKPQEGSSDSDSKPSAAPPRTAEPAESDDDENPTVALNLSAVKAAVEAELKRASDESASESSAPAATEADPPKAKEPAAAGEAASAADPKEAKIPEDANDDEGPTLALKVDDLKAAITAELKNAAAATGAAKSRRDEKPTSSGSDPSSDASNDDENPTVALKLDDVKAAVEAENKREAEAPPKPAARGVSQPAKERVSAIPSSRRPDGRALSMKPGDRGTSGYVAPEHLSGGEGDARSDQFSFAATMYVVLYGRAPFRFRNLSTYRDAVQRPPEAPPASPVPPWIHSVIERGLKRNPEHRFSTMAAMLDALDRDPSRNRQLLMFGAAAAAACVAGLIGYGQHRTGLEKQARQGATVMATIWNPQIEQRTRAALAQSGGEHAAETANRVTTRLSEYASTWTATHRRISEATLLHGEEDPATMARRLRCLDRGREQMAALTAIFSRPNGNVLKHAVEATLALPGPESCTTSRTAAVQPLVSTSDPRNRLVAVERAIAEASAHHSAGDDRAAEGILTRALAEVRAIPHPRTEAELLLLESECRDGRGDPQTALQSAEGAFHAAERAADDGLAARAAARIALLLGTKLDKAQEGERWMKAAESIADRAGRGDALEASLLSSRIPLNSVLGFAERNPALHDKEVAVLTRLYGERDVRVARALGSRGLTQSKFGKTSAAASDIQRAIDILTVIAGPGDVELAHQVDSLRTVQGPAPAKEAHDGYEHAHAVQVDPPPSARAVESRVVEASGVAPSP